jgi:hypothetical protein
MSYQRSKGAKGLGSGGETLAQRQARWKLERAAKKKEEERKRIRNEKARQRYYAKRDRDVPHTSGPSAAAWQGLENTKKGDATWLYKTVRKDAKEKGYNVSKTEAAAIAKKYVGTGNAHESDADHAIESARRHHGVEQKKKRQKK